MALTQAPMGNSAPGTAGGTNLFTVAQPAPQTTALAAVGQQVKLPNGMIITVGSQADAQALQNAFTSQQQMQQQQMTDLSRGTSLGGMNTSGLIDIAADGFTAVTGFLAGSNYNNKLQDFQDARDALLNTRDNLTTHRASATDPTLVDLMINSIDSQLDTLDAAVGVLNTQIQAVDMFAGGSAAKVVGKFVGNGGGGSGLGTAAAIGAGALGLGLILRNNSNTTTSRRRTR